MHNIHFRDVENERDLPTLQVTDFQLSALIGSGMVEMIGDSARGTYSRGEVVHYVATWLS